MVETISSAMHIARKEHEDSAGVWIRESLQDLRGSGLLTFKEWRAIARLKANGWNIKPGQRYERSYNKQDGDLYTFKCLPEVNAICQKLGLYDDC